MEVFSFFPLPSNRMEASVSDHTYRSLILLMHYYFDSDNFLGIVDKSFKVVSDAICGASSHCAAPHQESI